MAELYSTPLQHSEMSAALLDVGENTLSIQTKHGNQRTFQICGRRYVVDVDELRAWWYLTWTTGLAQLFRQSPPFIDIAMLGHLGTLQLSASSTAQVWTTVSSLWIWTGQEEVISTLSSQSYGHKNYKLTGVWLQLAAMVSTLIAIPVGISWLFTQSILEGIGFDDRSVTDLSETFARWYLLSLWPLLMFSCVAAWLNAMSKSALVLISSMATVCISILTNYFLIFGTQQAGGNWEGLGFIGSPISSGIATWSALAIIVVWIRWAGLHKQTWPGWLPRDMFAWKNLASYMEQAIPNFIGAILEVLQLQILSALAAHLGEVEIATHNAMFNVYMVVTSLMFGAIRATSVRVGHQLGAQNVALAKHVMWISLSVLSAIGLVTGVVLIAVKDEFAKMFSDDPAVWSQAASIMPLCAGSIVLYAVMFAGVGVLLGQGKPGTVAIAVMIGNWVVCVPLAFILTKVANMGLFGIWLALIVGYCVVTVMIGWFMYRTDWDKAMAEAVERSKSEKMDENTALLSLADNNNTQREADDKI